MTEFYAGGVQAESAGGIGTAVEPVSFDRGAESQRVCRVDSQLVGASCQRAEQYFRPSFAGPDDLVQGHCLFPVLEIHFLAGTVVIVRCKGQGYGPA